MSVSLFWYMCWASVLERYYQLIKDLYLEQKEKVILGFFLVLILVSQSADLRKKFQKKPDNKRKIKTSRDVTQFFWSATSIIISIVISINNLFYVDLQITSTIM